MAINCSGRSARVSDRRCLNAAHLPTGRGAAGEHAQRAASSRRSDAPNADCDSLHGARLLALYQRRVLDRPQATETVQSAAFVPGRLVLFMSESLHRVTPLRRGRRNVLFLWFHCDPRLGERVDD